MKYKNKLVADIKEEHRFEEEQNALKDKHGIENPDVIVVEKTNMLKFLIRSFGILVRVVASIIILVLATIGVITLIYPDLRLGLLETFNSIFTQFQFLTQHYQH